MPPSPFKPLGLAFFVASIGNLLSDDILIFSPTFEVHLKHLQEVFARLKQANLKLQPSKCHFALQQLKFLGHIITREGVEVDPAKTDSIR